MEQRVAESKCPICKKPVETDRTRNPAWPFCSKRCKTIDLGRWLGEDYRIAESESAPQNEAEDSVPPRGER